MGKIITSGILSLSMLLSVMLLPATVRADTTVYTTATGTHYHMSRSCNGLSNAKKIYEDTLSNAQAKHLEPCELCCTGSSSSGSTSNQSSQTEASAQANSTSQTDASASAATDTQSAGSQTVNVNDYLKITGIKKAKDGTWISMKLKNVSGKAVRISPYIVVQDKNKSGFAWSQPVKNLTRRLEKGNKRNLSLFAMTATIIQILNQKPRVIRLNITEHR